MSQTRASIAAALVACGVMGSASALGGVVFTGSDAFGRAARVEFAQSGSNLVVTLKNTSVSDALVPTDILTAVFWSFSGSAPSLSRVSAVLGAGSFVVNDPQPAGGVVGGEFAFASGFAPVSGGTFGLSSVGLDLFGPPDRFPGPDLEPPTSPDGLQYGITSAADNIATGNGGLLGTPLIVDTVVLTLSGLPVGFDLGSIQNVSFQYGTGLSEPRIPGVPGPGAAGLLGLGGVLALRRRR